MKVTSLKRAALVAAIAGSVNLSCMWKAQAVEVNKDWAGITNTTWSTTTNWIGGSPAGSTDNAIFSGTFTGSSQPAVNAATTVNGIWMTGAPGKSVSISRTSPGSLTITPVETINGISGLGLLVDHTDAFGFTFGTPVVLGAAQEWRNTTENIVAIQSAAANILSGSGPLTIRTTGSTLSSSVRMSNRAHTFSGQLTVAQGVYRIDAINGASANGELGNNALSVILGAATDVLGAPSDILGVLRFSSTSMGTVSSSKQFTMTSGGRGGFWVDSDSAGTPVTLSLSGKISGGGKLVKLGAMDNGNATTLELASSSNDWSGGTLITDGFISISAGNRLADGTVTLDYNPQYITNTGQGHSNVAGLKFTGNTTLTAPTKNIVINPGAGSVGGIIDVTNSDSTLAGDAAISGLGVLNKAGTGTLRLTGDNSGYIATITVAAGKLMIGSNSATGQIGTGNIILSDASANNGGLVFNRTDTMTISNLISGTGNVFQANEAATGITILSNTNTYTGNTTVSAGTLNVTGNHTTGANYSVAANANLITNNVRVTNALTVDGTATINANGGAAGASKVETLNIGVAGKLDLKDNDLVVGTAADVTDVRAAIKTGVAGAAGITSDQAGFGVTRGFGYAKGNDSHISPSLAGSLTGQSFDADSVLVKYTFLGDADLDGDSDLNDLGFWASAFTGELGNQPVPTTYWTTGDFNHDGDTDLDDLGLWSSTFTGELSGGPGSLIVYAPSAPAGAISALNAMGITVVPEPSTMILGSLAVAGICSYGLRRRKRNIC